MLSLDQLSEVFQSLRRHKLRTALTACGVFWGVFMLVLMLGFGNGLERAIVGTMGNWAQNAVFLWGEPTSKAYAGRQPGRRVQLLEEDGDEIKARVRGVDFVTPRNNLGGYGGRPLVSRKDRSGNFSVSGEMPDYFRLETLIIETGRFLNVRDMSEARKVAVIGSRVQEALFPGKEDPVGQSIRVGTVELTVIGVFRSPASGGDADWTNGRVFIPRTTFKRTFGVGNKVDFFAVLVAPGRSSAEVEDEVRALLKARHAVHPDDPRAIASYNRDKEFRKFTGLFLGIAALTWVVGLATLLAGAIGVSNIMMIAVAERTKEIGIRKAIGATPRSILWQILQEAMVLTGLAGYTGLIAGVGVLELVGWAVDRMPKADGPAMFSRPEIDLVRALVAVLVLTVAAVLAGLAPARSALAVRPVEALAHE